jgi:hypothetical protein
MGKRGELLREELLGHLPKDGFLKVSADKPSQLSDAQRVALIRKGNELFNQKKLELARKIFLTTGYSDGLIRLGDEYLRQSQPLEALRMYLLAPDSKKAAAMMEKAAGVLRHWLSEPTAGPAESAAPAKPSVPEASGG